MQFTEFLRQAFDSLWSHKLRSALTLLGIIIGISTLITVVTLIEGADRFVEEQMSNLNPDVYQISQYPRVSLNFNDYIKARKWKELKYPDYLALETQLPATDRIGVAATANDLVRRGSQY
ncbi:MAG: ABC transporter permease, partial [Acidobacteriota bacterium]